MDVVDYLVREAFGLAFGAGALLQIGITFLFGAKRGLMAFLCGFAVICLVLAIACAVTFARHRGGYELVDTVGFGLLGAAAAAGIWFVVGLVAFGAGLLLRVLGRTLLRATR